MRKSRFTEMQIVKTEAGGRRADCEGGLPRSTDLGGEVLQLEVQVHGMEAADIGKLKELTEENAKLKRMCADLAQENTALKDVIARKLQVRLTSARW